MGKGRLLGMLLGLALGAAAMTAPATAAADPPAQLATSEPTPPRPTLEVPLDGDAVLPPSTTGARGRARIQKWPGDTIRYWVDAPKSYQWAIAKAAEAWNDTGVDMKFVETSKAKSQLTIEVARIPSAGLATLGYTPVRKWRWVKLATGLMGRRGFGGGLTYDERRVFLLHVATHELGHTLGIDHRNTRCGLMGPTIYIGVCKVFTERPGFYACQVVDKPALDKAVGMYGGKRDLAPAQCPMDPLPPELAGVSVSGGGPSGDPALVTWDRPARAPAGTKVEVLSRTDHDSCSFPTRGDGTKLPRYGAGVDVRRVPLTDDGVTVSARGNETEVCIGVRSVNQSLGGAQPQTTEVVLYVPQPPPPVVELVSGSFSDPEEYLVRLDVPTDDDGSPHQVYVGYGPEGSCPTAYADDWDSLYVDEAGVAEVSVYDVGDRPCLAFVTRAGGRASEVVTYQVGDEPPPGAPAVGGVRRDPVNGGYLITSADGQPFSHEVLALVRPSGQCAPTTWPGDEDKHSALAGWEQGGTYRVWDEQPQACVTVYLVDRLGRVGPGVAVQTPPAAPPTKPTITAMSIVDEYTIRFDATYDVANDALVAVVAPQGECVTAWSEDVQQEYVWEEDGSYFVDNWTGDEHPCVSVFAVNADGVHSAPAVRQL